MLCFLQEDLAKKVKVEEVAAKPEAEKEGEPEKEEEKEEGMQIASFITFI